MTAFIKKIAASKESEETQRYAGNLNGIEIKLTYYYKGISFYVKYLNIKYFIKP